MMNTRCTGKARSGSSALAAPVVASVGTQTEPTGKETVVQSSGYPKRRVSNGRGYTLRSLVEVLLQQVAELQEAVTRMKGVREAEGEQHCLLRDQTVPGPRVSTVAPAGKEATNPGKEAANPGSWEKSHEGSTSISSGLQYALWHGHQCWLELTGWFAPLLLLAQNRNSIRSGGQQYNTLSQKIEMGA
ncbi:hypothetical protein AAES_141091 [Amazona aestiva]|uniref:Uncharacterized protein n=1 Tax=Amazona aestiva TaxID=12930 RepID=A0A0Q3PHY7_AMAAE|nr:hypothetical protein AAES_141091 [Amazona aestiva]